jgi:beta-galactosidase
VLKLSAKIGSQSHAHEFPFSVHPAPATLKVAAPVFVWDGPGDTAAMLAGMKISARPWKGEALPANALLVIGRKALSSGQVLPARVGAWVRGGGRLLVMGQDPRWIQYALGLRTAPVATRRVQSLALSAEQNSVQEMRDWRGASKVTEAYPRYSGLEWVPALGWKWGNRGVVSSAPMEKPHRSGLRPLLECEFDLAYTPLLEMEFGRGKVTLCTLDVEDHWKADPVAHRAAQDVIVGALAASSAPKAAQVLYAGGAEGAALLESLAVRFQKIEALPAQSAGQVLVLGADAALSEAAVRSFAQGGGQVLVLRRTSGSFGGAQVQKVAKFRGALDVPAWPQARGLSVSDVRWRADDEGFVLSSTDKSIEVGAGGQLARQVVGRGAIVWSQLSPDAVPADAKKYFRFTRWRQTRALSQVLANLGATFEADEVLVRRIEEPLGFWNLAGTWQVQRTISFPESPVRKWNSDPGMSEKAKSLVKVDAPAAGWQSVQVPSFMEAYGPEWRFVDGECVFRREITVPAHAAGKDLWLSVGRVDESEETFWNGESVGKSRSWLHPRAHKIPGRLVKAGRNVLALRTYDEGIHGGFAASPSHVFLRGDWDKFNLYHADYRGDDPIEPRDDQELNDWAAAWTVADNPYRYYRW